MLRSVRGPARANHISVPGFLPSSTIYLQRPVDGQYREELKKKAAGVDEFYVNRRRSYSRRPRAAEYLFKALSS